MADKFNTYIRQDKNEDIESFNWNHGTIFQTHDFLTVVGNQYACLVIESAHGEIVACLPLVKSRKHFLEAYHRPPYTYQFGPVIHEKHDQNRQAIIHTICANLPSSGHYDFKLFLEKGDEAAYTEQGFELSPHQTHLIPADSEYDLHALSNTKRRELQKLLQAEEAGNIRLIENEPSNLEMIEDLWVETAQRANFRVNREIVQQLFARNLKHYNNIITDHSGKPLCGTYCPMDRTTMYHLISANTRGEDKLLSTANVLALYSAICYANRQNLDFDTEGSNIPGIAQFYQLMGAKPKVIHRLQKSPSQYYRVLRRLAKIRRSL